MRGTPAAIEIHSVAAQTKIVSLSMHDLIAEVSRFISSYRGIALCDEFHLNVSPK
jgi:hypothetical protein